MRWNLIPPPPPPPFYQLLINMVDWKITGCNEFILLKLGLVCFMAGNATKQTDCCVEQLIFSCIICISLSCKWQITYDKGMSIPSSHYKRHCIKICTYWNESTISQLNRPPEVNITLIIPNLVLFFHWMQLNTLDFMKYFGAKSNITSWSLILWMTLGCNIVENM